MKILRIVTEITFNNEDELLRYPDFLSASGNAFFAKEIKLAIENGNAEVVTENPPYGEITKSFIEVVDGMSRV